jgi:hypothetical protein
MKKERRKSRPTERTTDEAEHNEARYSVQV